MARPKQNEKNDEFWVLLSISVMVIVQDGRVYFLGQECLKDRRLRVTAVLMSHADLRICSDKMPMNVSAPIGSSTTQPSPFLQRLASHSLIPPTLLWNCFFKFFINAMSRNAHLYGRRRWITSQRLRRWLLLKSHSLVEAVQNTTEWQVFSSFITFLFKH